MPYWNHIKSWLIYPWVYFKKIFKNKPNKYKYILFTGITGIVIYPLYSPYLRSILWQSNENLKQHLFSKQQQSKKNYVFKITENFIKNMINSILNDPYIRQQALDFINTIIQDEKFFNDILQLLLSGLKDPMFLAQLSNSAQNICKCLLKDDLLRKQAQKLIMKIINSSQVKQSLIELVKQIFSSKESVDTLVSLLQKGIKHEQVKQALTEVVNYSIGELLVDEQTLNHLKIFIFFLLKKFQNDQEIKSMMDILFAKGLGLVKKKKDHALEKLLKPENTPQ